MNNDPKKDMRESIVVHKMMFLCVNSNRLDKEGIFCAIYTAFCELYLTLFCFSVFYTSISVYKSSQRSKKVRLQHFFTPDKSTVTCLVYRSQYLYAGLVSGSVAIYSRAPGTARFMIGKSSLSTPVCLSSLCCCPARIAVLCCI